MSNVHIVYLNIKLFSGKLEFDKNHRTHEPVSKTMTRVETILSEFTSIFTDNTEDKAVRRDMHKAINDIEKILKKDDFGNLLF